MISRIKRLVRYVQHRIGEWQTRPLTGTYTAWDALMWTRKVIVFDHNRLDMAIWGVTDDEYLKTQEHDSRWGKVPACGSVGCLSGWAAIGMGLTFEEAHSWSPASLVPAFLGLTDKQREHLFLPPHLTHGPGSRSVVGPEAHFKATLAHLDAFMREHEQQLKARVITPKVREESRRFRDER